MLLYSDMASPKRLQIEQQKNIKKRPIWYFSLEDAKKFTLEDFNPDHWYLQKHPGGHVEVIDQYGVVWHTTKKQIKQLTLFQ